MEKNSQQDQGINALGNLLPEYYDIEKDLQYLYADERRFTRSEALRMVVFKIKELRDLQLVTEFLKYILKFKGKRFYFVDPERPKETLTVFLDDLKQSFIEFLDTEQPNSDHEIRMKGIWNLLRSFHNSMFRLTHGEYFLSFKHKADEEAEEFLNIVKGGSSENEVFVSFEEIKSALKISKNETFTKHFQKLGIERIGGYNTPLIRKSDFIKLKEFWKTR